MKKTIVGVIGCGVISQVYFKNLTSYKEIEVTACADMFMEKAQEAATRFNIPKACTVEELLKDPKIEIVVNLTIPKAHTEINLAALEAGKHVYCEKPLAMNMEDARKTLDLAAKKGLLVGCAPDTFLGAGLQTCRKLIDEGWIGTPVAATANLVCSGPEIWHPAPEFYYKLGGGPAMDMGPYYVTAMVSLLGPVDRLACFAKKTVEKRTVLSQPLAGKKTDVEVYTHYSGIMNFKNGVIANINMSFDAWLSNLPLLEIYGTAGTLTVPDPNFYGGPVTVLRGESMVDSIKGLTPGEAVDKIHSPLMYEFFKEIPLPYHAEAGNLRGLGILDMAYALAEKRQHRVNEKLAYHVTEVLTSLDTSAKEGGALLHMKSSCDRPAAMPMQDGYAE